MERRLLREGHRPVSQPSLKVSVNMLTYNHASHIARAIEGVLHQETAYPYELVIGEDCSTDGTRDIVWEYQGRHPDIIRVVTSDENVGAIKNEDRIALVSRGQYVAYCEGDDYWHRRDKLQRQVDFMENHPQCGLVYSDYDRYEVETGDTVREFLKSSGRRPPQPIQMADILTGQAGILTCTVLARRELIDHIRNADPYLYRETNFPMTDTQLWAEVSHIAAVHRIDESLATHQILAESLAHSKDMRKDLRFWIANAEMCLYLCTKYDLPACIRDMHESTWRRLSLKLAFLEKRKDLADLVKTRSRTLSRNEWFWYQGTKTPAMRPVVIFRNWLSRRLDGCCERR
jgi:glycosyltransferase involved in cell wall biosynthesis